jgi:hypothetical protein
MVSRLLLTPEAQLQSQGSPCRIYGRQSGTREGFIEVFLLSFTFISPPMLHSVI